MSKTIAQISKLLGAHNEQLFDRYINFRLLQDEPTGEYSPSDKDFQVICPRSGLKPDILVSGEFHVQNNAHLVTLTVTNMNANIDTMAYNWAEVEVGYYNSGIHTRFVGQITNCYMAKPNPNGELVVSIVCANIASMFTQGDFEVSFDDDWVTLPKLVDTCLDAIRNKYPKLKGNLKPSIPELPGDWAKQSFMVNKATYGFRSPLECMTWLNSLFMSYAYDTGYTRGAGNAAGTFDAPGASTVLNLPPLRLGFDLEGNLHFTGTYSKASPGMSKSISYIGSAFISGGAATVTAPFNPDIAPGEVIYVDPFYFKTRVNIKEMRGMYDALGNLWSVISMKFTFSTRSTNTMTLTLNNIENTISVEEG